ncbi:MAG: AI-2E family transporter [Oscillospiraceae bacterium]|nr:AI-2E family transporter [Oscillospiraceae bacterium]
MKLTWNDCLKIGVSIFGLYLCINLWPGAVALVKALLGASAPLILGCAIAYVVNILMRFFETHWPTTGKFSTAALKFRRPVSLLLAFASVAALVVLIVALIVPQLISCAQLLLSEIPGAMTKAVAFVNSLNIVPQDLLAPLLKVDWQSKLLDILATLTSGVGNVMGAVISTVSSVFSALVTGLLALIFSIYLLLSQEDLKRQLGKLLRRFLPSKWLGRLCYAVHTLDDCFHRYIVGQCLEAVIIGALCALGMGLLRLPYATMIGALVGFTALIPVAGAYIGAGVGAFMILTVDPIQALIFLVFLVILQQLEGNLIYPKVVGSSLGLPGIWVLAAVTVGGGLLGIGGMLLGVPLAAAIYRMLGEEVNSHPSEA